MTKTGVAIVMGWACVLGGCGGRAEVGTQTQPVMGQGKPEMASTPREETPAKPPAKPIAAPVRDCPNKVRPSLPQGEICIVAGQGHLAYVPLDGREPVSGPSVFTSTSGGSASLGLHNGALYMCNGNVTRVWLVDGYAESTDVPCEAVTANRGGIWVLDGIGSGVEHYANDAALLAHSPDRRGAGAYASRVAVRGDSDELSFAWHSTDEILVGEASVDPKPVKLAGYDGWIQGLDRLDDGRFVIGTWFTDQELRVHAADGSFLKSVSLEGTGIDMADGIVCGDGAELADEGGSCAAQEERRVSASLPGTCEGASSNYTASTDGPNEVHVIGVYEGQYDGPTHGGCWEGEPDPNYPNIPPCPAVRPRGKVSVHVKQTAKPIVLVLSTYEPIDYALTVDQGAKIAKIVTQGYYESSLTGAPAGTPIEKRGYTSGAYGWEPEHNTGGSNFEAFIADIRKREGAESSFNGCYAGDHFEVPFR